MYFSIGSSRLRVNQDECNAFTGEGGLIAATGIAVRTQAAAAGEAPVAGVLMAVEQVQGSEPMALEPVPGVEKMPVEQVLGGAQMPAEQVPGSEMPSEQVPGMPMSGEQVSDEQFPRESVPGTPMPGEQVSAGQVPVEEFTSQIYFEGLPLDQAAEYGEEDVAILLDMLSDPDQVRYHENIALTLGMIGSERAVDPLISYIQQGTGEAGAESAAEDTSRPAYKGRVGAMVALGYLVNLSGSEMALDFLMDSTSPDIWDVRSFEGLVTTETPLAERRRDLSKYAIISLGLSGNSEAAVHLQSLKDEGEAASAEAFLAEVEDVISQSLQIHNEISQEGLVNYYK